MIFDFKKKKLKNQIKLAGCIHSYIKMQTTDTLPNIFFSNSDLKILQVIIIQEQFLPMASLLNKINIQDHLLLVLDSTPSHTKMTALKGT